MKLLAERGAPPRPRERALSAGIHVLTDAELLALLIGSGTPQRDVHALARDVLGLIDDANGVPDQQRLAQIAGLGPAKTAAILAAFELSRRILCPRRHRIRMPADVLPIVDRFASRNQECFIALSLNGAHEVIASRIVTVGLVNRTVVHPREVFADSITDRAAAIMLAHNHPSGSLEPSTEDQEVTTRMVRAGELIGIPVLDHVIFSESGYYSFLEHGHLH